jgi:hypothetical protein
MADRPPAERPYEFRRRLGVVHPPDRRDAAAVPDGDEVAVGPGWSIAVGARCDALVLDVARDLQDYLFTSMGESVLLRRVEDVAAEARTGVRVLVLATRDELPQLGERLATARSYRLVCGAQRVVVCGRDPRGAAQGNYFLEDLWNLRQAPYLRAQDVTREPLFSPRMTHSGWALDEFPDAHLNAIAHAGMDAILVFVCGVDRTPDQFTHHHPQPYGGRYLDLNDLVERAERCGLDVYLYAYFRGMSPPHPDDPGAADFYDATYGALFRACPRARGIVLVGESVEFPSKDPHTSGTLRFANGGIGLVNVNCLEGEHNNWSERVAVTGVGGRVFVENWRRVIGFLPDDPQAYHWEPEDIRPADDQNSLAVQGFVGELRDFAESVRDARPPACTIEDGIAALVLERAVDLSVERGARVRLSEAAG